MFGGEFAVPLSSEFDSGYRELQETLRSAQTHSVISETAARLRIAETLLVGRYRARVAVGRWLLVANPINFEICMRDRVWGRQQEAEVRRYAPGDVFFFHVTGISRISVLGMFTGQPFHDSRPLWPVNQRGAFPWRIRFLPLGWLTLGLPTKEILELLRRGSPTNWFHGFIQQSHALSEEEFEVLRSEFEAALRRQPFAGAV